MDVVHHGVSWTEFSLTELIPLQAVYVDHSRHPRILYGSPWSRTYSRRLKEFFRPGRWLLGKLPPSGGDSTQWCCFRPVVGIPPSGVASAQWWGFHPVVLLPPSGGDSTQCCCFRPVVGIPPSGVASAQWWGFHPVVLLPLSGGDSTQWCWPPPSDGDSTLWCCFRPVVGIPPSGVGLRPVVGIPPSGGDSTQLCWPPPSGVIFGAPTIFWGYGHYWCNMTFNRYCNVPKYWDTWK